MKRPRILEANGVLVLIEISLQIKRPLGRPRRRWEGNIRMDLEEIGISAGDWVDSAQDKDYLNKRR